MYFQNFDNLSSITVFDNFNLIKNWNEIENIIFDECFDILSDGWDYIKNNIISNNNIYL